MDRFVDRRDLILGHEPADDRTHALGTGRDARVAKKVGASTEPATGAGQHDGPQGSVEVDPSSQVLKIGHELRRDRVEALGPVHGDEHDVVVGLLDQEGGVLGQVTDGHGRQ